MELDNTTVVANVLINGMTEEEVFQSRCALEAMLPIYAVKLEDEDILWKIIFNEGDNDAKMISLLLCREFWKLYSENKATVHMGLNAAQPNIYQVVH